MNSTNEFLTVCVEGNISAIRKIHDWNKNREDEVYQVQTES